MQVDNRRQNSKSTLGDNHGFRNCATAPCYKLSCNESHALIGSSIVHCIHGKWNASFPSCKGMLFTYVKKKDIQLLFIRSVCYSVGHLKEKSWRQFPIKWCSQQHTIVHKRPSLSECWKSTPSFPVINDFGTIKHICCINPEEARKHWTTQRTHWISYSCQR